MITFLEIKAFIRNLKNNRNINFKSVSMLSLKFLMIMLMVIVFKSFNYCKDNLLTFYYYFFGLSTLITTNTEFHKNMYKQKQVELLCLYPIGYKKALSRKFIKCSIMGCFKIFAEVLFVFISVGILYDFKGVFLYTITYLIEIICLYEIKAYIAVWQTTSINNNIMWALKQIVVIAVVISLNEGEMLFGIFYKIKYDLLRNIVGCTILLLLNSIAIKHLMLVLMEKRNWRLKEKTNKIIFHFNKITINVKEKLLNYRIRDRKNIITKIYIYIIITVFALIIIYVISKRNSDSTICYIIWISCIENIISLVNELLKQDVEKNMVYRYWLSGISVSKYIKRRCIGYIKYISIINIILICILNKIESVNLEQLIISFLHICLCVTGAAIVNSANINYINEYNNIQKKGMFIYKIWNVVQSIIFCIVIINEYSKFKILYIIYQIICAICMYIYLMKDRKVMWGDFFYVLEN